MRVSTAQFQQRAVATILEQQTRLSETQSQVATGKRILRPADDPSAATRSLGLERELALTDQYQANSNLAARRLAMGENVLASVTDLLQRASELVVQGNNDSYGAQDRRAIAVELRARLDELLGLANTRDANGEYLFSGFQGNTQPFSQDGDGSFSYNGDQGQRHLHIGPGVKVAVTDSGADVFELIRSGNGTFTVEPDAANVGTGVITQGWLVGDFIPDSYSLEFLQPAPEDPITYEVRDSANNLVTSGSYVSENAITFNGAEVSVSGTPANGDRFSIDPSGHQGMFSTVHNLVQAFEGAGEDPISRTELHNAVNRGLAELGSALENVLEVRTRLGSRLNLAENQAELNADFALAARDTLSSLQDVDYAEAISRLQLQITSLQAAQQSYLKIQDLSLFNFIR
jgi:flagellar hook-associated protein 3 FlgL